MDRALGTLVAAVAANGVLAGASLDQSIKQLPARRRIGAAAYRDYFEAADLSNGVPWYAFLGVGSAVMSLAGVATGLAQRRGRARSAALVLLGVSTIGHSFMTSRAAPRAFSTRVARGDEQAAAAILDSFTRFQVGRAALQVLAFAASLWALVSTGRAARPAARRPCQDRLD